MRGSRYWLAVLTANVVFTHKEEYWEPFREEIQAESSDGGSKKNLQTEQIFLALSFSHLSLFPPYFWGWDCGEELLCYEYWLQWQCADAQEGGVEDRKDILEHHWTIMSKLITHIHISFCKKNAPLICLSVTNWMFFYLQPNPLLTGSPVLKKCVYWLSNQRIWLQICSVACKPG